MLISLKPLTQLMHRFRAHLSESERARADMRGDRSGSGLQNPDCNIIMIFQTLDRIGLIYKAF